MPTATQKLAAELLAKRQSIAPLFEKKTADGRYDWTATDRDNVQKVDRECDDLHAQLEAARGDEALEKKNRDAIEQYNQVTVPGSFDTADLRRRGIRGHDGAQLEVKSFGHRFIEHKGYASRPKGFVNGFQQSFPDFEVKTLFQTSAGFDPFVPRMPLIALSPQQRPRVVDLLPTSQTEFHSVKWMLETLYTNGAASTAEGALYPESALQFTEQLSPVRKISTFLPVTDEQFEDAPRTRDLVNNRLELMIRQTLDRQLLAGDGTGTNLTGLATLAGIQTRAIGADPLPTALYKAMTQIKTVGFAEPSGIILNPLDWQSVKLMQTADGLYIWGHPSQEGPNRIWGLPVVDTTYQAQGVANVGDYAMHTELIWRSGLEFLVSNSHADFFARGQLAIRADIRVAFICTRPSAICTVTGIPLAN